MSQLFNKYPGDDKSWLNWHFFVQIVPLYVASMSQLFSRHPSDHKSPIFHPKSATLMSQLFNKYPGDYKSWLNWHFFVQIVPLYVALMSQLFSRHPWDSKSSIFSHNLPHQCRSSAVFLSQNPDSVILFPTYFPLTPLSLRYEYVVNTY